jgi:hypothetical protein
VTKEQKPRAEHGEAEAGKRSEESIRSPVTVLQEHCDTRKAVERTKKGRSGHSADVHCRAEKEKEEVANQETGDGLQNYTTTTGNRRYTRVEKSKEESGGLTWSMVYSVLCYGGSVFASAHGSMVGHQNVTTEAGSGRSQCWC